LGLGALGLALLALWGYGRGRQHAAATCTQTTIHFTRNAATLGADDKVAVRQLADCMKMNPSQTVRLEGRADASEIQTNAAIAQERADTLARELRALGVPASQYNVTTSATTCNEETDTCWQVNRSATAVPLPHRR